MLRMTLLEIVVFSVPFSLFFLYRNFILRHRRLEGEAFDPAPYHVAFIISGVLSLVLFVFLTLQHKSYRDVDYIPAHLENGKVIKGKFVPTQKRPDAASKRDHDESAGPPGPEHR